ncbi:hypothetical protein [Stutzerimonas nitrititolerans]|uniref:hypothetical protein n=1 Tax=Stutzerimonas nitrititolerans TaxID=2482751 RepID=UPI00289ED201|nr:hypothetical protein [Stutzerimonas nitrititolerans]
MNLELLKTSLRHTHAYIDAYGVDHLQDVEMLFRQALEQASEEEDLDEDDEQEDFSGSLDIPSRPAAVTPVVESMIETAAPAQEEYQRTAEQRLVPVANWHFQLPVMVAGMAVAILLLRGWLS